MPYLWRQAVFQLFRRVSFLLSTRNPGYTPAPPEFSALCARARLSPPGNNSVLAAAFSPARGTWQPRTIVFHRTFSRPVQAWGGFRGPWHSQPPVGRTGCAQTQPREVPAARDTSKGLRTKGSGVTQRSGDILDPFLRAVPCSMQAIQAFVDPPLHTFSTSSASSGQGFQDSSAGRILGDSRAPSALGRRVWLGLFAEGGLFLSMAADFPLRYPNDQ